MQSDSKMFTNALFLVGAYCVRIESSPNSQTPLPLIAFWRLILIIFFQVLRLKWDADRTWRLLKQYEGTFIPFNFALAFSDWFISEFLEHYVDASPSVYDYGLPMHSCFKGLEKAQKLNWINLEEFNHEEYAYYEQVEHGDWNWIIPGRLLSFASPTQEYTDDGMVVTHPPCTPTSLFISLIDLRRLS